MDQQAKKHLQDEFDAALEEKDQMITVLQTQVSVMVGRWEDCLGLQLYKYGSFSLSVQTQNSD